MSNHWTAASVATLAEVRLDCEAQLIRAIWKAETRADLYDVYPPAEEIDREFYNRPFFRELKMLCLDRAAGFHGAELLGWHKRARAHVYYLNAGDTYATTLLFIGRRLVVGCWGDLVERGYIAGAGHD